MHQLKIKQSITNRSGTLNSYFKDVSQEGFIDTEEECRLAELIKKGDKTALDKLVRANLRFAISVAKQYQNNGLPLEDLIQEANLGLCKAATLFDETRGFKFISYAVWWIRQYILLALSNHSRNIRIPANQVSVINKINKKISSFEQEHNRRPTSSEISELMDMPKERVEELTQSAIRSVSLDTSINDDENSTLLDVIPGEEPIDNSIDLTEVLNLLTNREHDVIMLYFGIGVPELPQDEIANLFGLTSERIRQIKETAIKKLRKDSNKIRNLCLM